VTQGRRAAVAIAWILLGAHGCGPRLTPEEKVEFLRSQYSAELKSVMVSQDPVAPGEQGTDPAGATATAVASGPGPSATDGRAAPAVHQDATLDIVVSATGEEQLPGVTIDLRHLDADGREKDQQKLWIDTSTMVRGADLEITHVIENVDYAPGDDFLVEVRTPIPAAERAEYREFEAH
jgi:hypothetical protein